MANSLRPIAIEMLRIKSVTLKGFKTFAQRTEFAFGSGVTAIVGPNGCGKSNIADAVRWCLGEQSFGLLRSKKTVDVIFAGSEKKARQGMAAVSIVLDNEAGDLNIDFSEVRITRRAYRDGDNEYLINGQRVRLQDITQLLGPSGLGRRAYAVIGQGLIDRVLSLRPEERRALFEEAAGITGYQQKRAVALRRLEATQLNLDRIRDVLTELSPRLNSLRRQAERALERIQIEADLKELLQVWYGYQWHRTLGEIAIARQHAERDQDTTQVRREQLDIVHARLDKLRLRQSRLRAEQSERNQISESRHRRTAEVIRRLAVSQERLNQMVARQEDLRDECCQLQTDSERVQQRLVVLSEEIETVQERRNACRQALDRLQIQLAESEKEQGAAQERWRADVVALRDAESRSAEFCSRQEQLVERRAALQESLTRLRSEIQQRNDAAQKADAALATLETAIAAGSTEFNSTQSEVDRLTEAIEVGTAALQAEEDALNREQREVERLRTRLDLLLPTRAEGTVYASAVHSILEASHQGKLDGILGTVASRIQVPTSLERAIEVALGAALQNVIATSWQDAQGAIEFLRRTGAGRATFLPLDRLQSRGPIPAPTSNGILGNAARSVRFDSEVAPAMHHLLQRVWIAHDLSSARHALDLHSVSFSNGRRPRGRDSNYVALPTVVTLEGEIIRPGGAVTGGNDGKRHRKSVLAWEREVRELPGDLARVEGQARQAIEMTRSTRNKVEALTRKRAELERHRQLLFREAQMRQSEFERARLHAAQARQEADWQQQILSQTQAELADLGKLEQQLAAASTESARTLHEARERAVLSESAARTSQDDMLRQLADLRAEAAAVRENLSSRRSLEADLRRSHAQIGGQLQSKLERQTELAQKAEQLRHEIDRASVEEMELQADGEAHRETTAEMDLNSGSWIRTWPGQRKKNELASSWFFKPSQPGMPPARAAAS